MEILWVLLFLTVIFIFADKTFGIKKTIIQTLNPPPPPPPPPEYPYGKRTFLTAEETEFYNNLKPVAGEYSLIINMKTCLDDIIEIKNADDKNQLNELFDKIKYKSIDFVLIDPETMSTECFIEFRDGSHKEPNQIEEDKFLETICNKNNIDFIIYQGNFDEIKKYFNENWEKQI